MTSLDDVAHFVRRLAPEPVCENCVARTLAIDLNDAVQAVHELAGRQDFERRKGGCSLCGEETLLLCGR